MQSSISSQIVSSSLSSHGTFSMHALKLKFISSPSLSDTTILEKQDSVDK